ncbi:MAG TPA: hypothetical protein VM782_09525 [Stellaceae bacterium]|nr:hypothetical protein [Stellaceae bacterium]
MGGIAIVPAAIIGLRAGYYLMVPRYSAVVDFDQYGFNLRLDLFLTNDEARDSGRYLSVIHGGSYRTRMIPGWDWAHHPRTGIYRIDENHIAVLSAFGSNYEITLTPFNLEPVGNDNGEAWQYLGAFDFVFPLRGRVRLQFFDLRLPECIPMGAANPTSWADKPRAQARAATCQTPAPELAD